ncbi:unnamed protein product [Brachionus calyciflorus]|uniref:OTU domain-containing protein n=1 Tax=Brachionus calyciflorus TaxID=104777 RepID=A0A814PDZ2_9BILA|nr:unnamed protein product [Brachionus calyciflorus]
MSNLFRFDKNNKKVRYSLPDSLTSTIPNNLEPIVSLFKISNQSLYFIRNYIQNNRDFLISLVKQLRENKGVCYYNSHYYDQSHYTVLEKWNCSHGICLSTTGDGNCLYNAISLSLYEQCCL